MRSSARVWTLVAGLFVLHFVLQVGFGVGVRAPDFLTVALMIAAREVQAGWAATIGFSFGLLEDALSVFAFGSNTVTMTFLGLAGAFTRDLFVGDSWWFVFIYFFVGKWLRDLAHWLMVGEAVRQPFVDQVLIHGLVGALYAAVVGTLLVAFTGFSGEA